MATVSATRTDDGFSLVVDTGSSIVTGSLAAVPVPERIATFLFLLVSRAPQVFRYEAITAEVLEPHYLGGDDPMSYIRKLKLEADRKLIAATGTNKLIVAVRAMGYRLDGTWANTVLAGDDDLPALLDELRRLADTAIELMRLTPLIEGEDGELFLDQTHAGSHLQILAQKYLLCANALADAARPEPSRPTPRFVQTVLADLHSYFTFGRRGQVAETVWRDLFRRELNQRINILEDVLA